MPICLLKRDRISRICLLKRDRFCNYLFLNVLKFNFILASINLIKRDNVSLLLVGKKLGIKRFLVVTWDEEKELEGGIQVVPVWKLLAGYEPVFK